MAKDLACLEIQRGSKWVHIVLYLGSIDHEVSITANPFKYQKHYPCQWKLASQTCNLRSLKGLRD